MGFSLRTREELIKGREEMRDTRGSNRPMGDHDPYLVSDEPFPEWAPRLACPECRGLLVEAQPESSEPEVVQGPEWSCERCGASYRALDGLPDLTPPGLDEMKAQERSHYTDNIEYYLRMHSTWHRSPFYLHYHRAFQRLFDVLPPGSLILECGCGLGHDGLELLRKGYLLVATDISPGQLREARRLHRREGFGGSSLHLLADAENLPFADGSFQGVLMVASLHHLHDPLRALREAHRVLKPGGLLVLGTEPNRWQSMTIYPLGKALIKVVERLTGRKILSDEMVSEADKKAEGFFGRELETLFSKAGFREHRLLPAGYLSAALFFLCTELSQRLPFNLKLFPLEAVFVFLDDLMGDLPLIRRLPWHWNAYARKVS